MEYWNSLLTEKSWNSLQELKKRKFEFILIGGWAIYLWTKLQKSKDIDIALKDLKNLEYLRNNFDLRKNEHLKKYEIKIEEIDIDVYVPYYSKLPIPIEALEKNTTKIEGITVVKPEELLILKQGAELERKDSIKGEKDRIDIITLLLYAEIDFKRYKELLKKYKLTEFEKRLKQIIKGFKEIKYINLNPRELKLTKQEIMKKLFEHVNNHPNLFSKNS